MPATVVARFVRLKSRCLRSGSSTTGERCQEQRLRKSAASAIEATNAPMMRGEVQPQVVPCTIPSVSSASDSARIIAPARSGSVRRPGERLSTSLRPASTTTSAPIGTFTRKQSRQSERWISVPPIGGPSAAAMAAEDPYTVSARARRPAGNAFTTSAREAGTTIAPPSAWSARAPMRKPADGATAQRALAVVNRTTPAWNMRLRPSRSASRPDPTRNAANTMLYASKIQLSVVSVAPLKSARMLGNAMFTIVESTNSMNTPSEAIARTVAGLTALRVTRPAATSARGARAVPKGAGAVSSYVIEPTLPDARREVVVRTAGLRLVPENDAECRRAATRVRNRYGISHGGEEMLLLARIVRIVTAVVVGFILVGILLHVLDANSGNAVVGFVYDVAGWLVTPFKGLFSVSGAKLQIALNWGLAAVVYGVV